MLKEFKEFAMRGNVLDMAVGIIIGAAFGKIAPEAPAGRGGHCREPGQLGVGLVVAGQQRQGDAMLAAGFDQALDPVRPIGAAAQEAGDDQPRLGDQLHV